MGPAIDRVQAPAGPFLVRSFWHGAAARRRTNKSHHGAVQESQIGFEARAHNGQTEEDGLQLAARTFLLPWRRVTA